jgi:PAS domain S-box-containing protein
MRPCKLVKEQAADAIALFDNKGKILEVNDSAVNLLGYKYGELMNLYLSDILTKEEMINNPVQYDLLRKGVSTIKRRGMRKKDGSTVMVEVNSKILPDGRFLSMVRDLTDRIEAQKQIEKEKELSDNIIDSLPGVFYFYDQNGKFIRWNKQLEIVTGYSGKEISKMHPTQLFEGEDVKYIEERIAKVFAEGVADAEADFVFKDGSRKPYYFKAILVDFEGQPCLLGTGIDISDRKKAEMELTDSYKAIRKLTSHLQNVREEDRAHIAREIHDELGQQLTVLKMDVSWVNKKLGTTDELIKQKMKDLLVMLDETVKTVRRISSELRPSLLDDLGLTAAMEWQLHEFKKRSGIKTSFSAPELEIKLPDMIKTGLFRIFQESLTNVVRHSYAKKLKISLEHKDSNFVLTIADDGKGFDKDKVANKRTLGILGMKERTSMIGGIYDISSTPGKGTTVVVSIPWSEQNN